MLIMSSAVAKETSVLFIGNSFTKMNNFSTMVSEIGNSLGDNIYTDFSAIDSYTLEKHSKLQQTIDKINSRKWDFVVLQEQSQRPIMDTSTKAKVVESIDKLMKMIYTNNSSTQVLLFMTWGRKYGDSDLCKALPYTCSYDGMQDALRDAYWNLGYFFNVRVVPCGIAWKTIMHDSLHNIDLFYPDNKHPNEAGSYLNACMFYNAITGRTAEGNAYKPNTLSESKFPNSYIPKLQVVSFEIMQQYYFNIYRQTQPTK